MTSSLLWTLVALQLAMGLFDIFYHHELTERLPWRPSQQHELALQGLRNALYAVLFLMLGLVEPHGILAMLVIAALAVEIVITLVDFVEEDLSRKLPASERVLHTLLALNYGAILCLLVPVLAAWAQLPTAVVPAWYGLPSALAPFAAAGVVVFALRDISAARRAPFLLRDNGADLVAALPGRQHVLVTGATGFIGRRLVGALVNAGHDVIVLTRAAPRAATLQAPLRVVTSLDQIASDTPIDAIVNLAGESIAGGLWTRERRRKILGSRLRMTNRVVRLVARLERRPAVLINGSAVGWYGLWQDEQLTEFDGGKRCFTHRVCEAWERGAKKAAKYGTRVVRLRTGLVLATDGGLLGQLLPPFEFGLGGPIGSGRQWVSWIERDDLVRLIAHVIATPQLTGAVNATAPMPVTNAVLARELGHALNRPARLRIPGVLLHHLAGDFADELLLGGQRVLPDKVEGSGFKFRHAALASALAAMVAGNADVDASSSVARAPQKQMQEAA